MGAFVKTDDFQKLNVGVCLDEGDYYFPFFYILVTKDSNLNRIWSWFIFFNPYINLIIVLLLCDVGHANPTHKFSIHYGERIQLCKWTYRSYR